MLSYDPRYLAGIRHFNAGEYFDAHEVWEGLWRACAGPERGFYKGLIQAAVALYHLRRGNSSGATRLARSGQAYMLALGPRSLGLDAAAFWGAMRAFLAGAAGPAPLIHLTPPDRRGEARP
jgi:predicted metal-dependent hydrolase